MTTERKSFRTPLGRAINSGSSRYGTDEHQVLKLSAVAMIPLTIGFVWTLLTLLPKDYNAVRAELGEPLPAVIVLLFAAVGIYHMQIGMRAVIIDYVHGATREWTLIANALFSLAIGALCVYAILRIGFV